MYNNENLEFVDITEDLIAKYSNHLKDKIIDVKIVQSKKEFGLKLLQKIHQTMVN